MVHRIAHFNTYPDFGTIRRVAAIVVIAHLENYVDNGTLGPFWAIVRNRLS